MRPSPSKLLFGNIFTPPSKCILQIIIFFLQMLSKSGILHLENKKVGILLIQHAQKRLRRRKVAFFRFISINQSKKEFARFFIYLKLDSLVAEYFEEKPILSNSTLQCLVLKNWAPKATVAFGATF